jgi:hypothetical protein
MAEHRVKVDTWIPRPELGENVATQVPAGEVVPAELVGRPAVTQWPPAETKPKGR